MKKKHQKGGPRIYTTIKVNTRIDKLKRFKDKINSVLDNQIDISNKVDDKK